MNDCTMHCVLGCTLQHVLRYTHRQRYTHTHTHTHTRTRTRTRTRTDALGTRLHCCSSLEAAFFVFAHVAQISLSLWEGGIERGIERGEGQREGRGGRLIYAFLPHQ
jgi:hypothetical protein